MYTEVLILYWSQLPGCLSGCLSAQELLSIESPKCICDWQMELSNRLDLKGRIRVSPEGLNGTLGGSLTSIHMYIEEMKQREELRAHSVDWKISGAVDRYSLESQQFDSLSCKVTKEVVSLDLSKQEIAALLEVGPGEHLSPRAFHEEIERACSGGGVGSANVEQSKPLVLLDVRNIYETEIGRFDTRGKGEVPVIDPQTRKFSDFKRYIDTHHDELNDKRVFLYCTGGVKCERASAYIKLRAPASSVYQLTGGICRYQEEFPEGGFFHGRNFVYDPRRALPSAQNQDEVVGRCRVCVAPWDDYAAEVRCNRCRMLQLVCDNCRENDAVFLQDGVVCEMCTDKR